MSEFRLARGDGGVEVTVVIPARNVASTLGDQLEALSGQDFDGAWEVVVADNGSTDATRVVAESYCERLPSLCVVDASARRGVNAARNAGVRAGRGTLILFCDGDDIVTSGWVRAMATTLRSYDAVGGLLQRFGPSGEVSTYAPLEGASTFMPYPIGANCGVKRDAWLAVGGFDEEYDGGSCDEIEFFWRVQLAGYRLGNANDAVVRYRTYPERELRKRFRNGRETARLYRDFREFGHPGHAVSSFRGWGWIISRLPLALLSSKRRTTWSRAVAVHLGRAVGSIKYRRPRVSDRT
jgi:glycosyltransferase involved in cell wall biosynthesis